MSGIKKVVKVLLIIIVFSLVFSGCSGDKSVKPTAKPPEADTVNNPPIPKAKYQAKKLYIANASSYDDQLTLSTLQGLLVNKGDEQIYIGSGTWVNVMKDDFGVEVITKNNTWSLLEKFKDKLKLSGYILCKTENGSVKALNTRGNIDRSVNVATTLANQLNAVVVTEGREQKAKDLGLKCVLDVRGWTEADLLNKPEYISKLNNKCIVEQLPFYGAQLRDYAVMTNSFSFFSDATEGKRQEFFNKIQPNSPIFGWSDSPQGEIGFISEASKNSLYTVCTNWSMNVSVLSGFRLEKLKQKTVVPGEKDTREMVHTVCFSMSDGDNTTWYLGGLYDPKWFASKVRGTFPMGWGMPIPLIDVAAPAMKFYYDKMTEKDGFVFAGGGLGYTYPSMWKKDALEKQVLQINDYADRSDVNIMQIIDENSFDNTDLWNIYLKQPNIDAVFYLNYNNYAGMNGAIRWVNGKPLIGARFNLWKDLPPGGNPDSVIKAVNAASKNPKSDKGYSLIVVHAWSMTMNDVKKCVDGFSDKVRVVTPQEFVKLINENLKPA